eukprot:11150770-Alexandrium_andersonii.AAC.1
MAIRYMRDIHFPPERIDRVLQEEHPRASERGRARLRQKLVVDILSQQMPSIIPRIRQKLQRWHMCEASGPSEFIAPRILALRAASNLQFIFKHLPPR